MSERFQCMTCMNWFNMMWGNTCNLCRDANKKHEALVNAARASGKTIEHISQLQAELAQLKEKCASYEDQANKLMFHMVCYYEYFTAIERGEYDKNRRSAPLRGYEMILQNMYLDLNKKHNELLEKWKGK